MSFLHSSLNKTWGQNHDYDPEQFVIDLDKFLGGIPKGISYGVEVRDDIFINPGYEGYLNCLKSHNVSHVINEQTHMPPISEQVKRKGIITSDRIVIRALTRRGMTHAAVKRYEPYEKTLEPLPDMRSSIAQLIYEAVENGWEMQTYVNNRAEGNAPNTIHAILDLYDELCGELHSTSQILPPFPEYQSPHPSKGAMIEIHLLLP